MTDNICIAGPSEILIGSKLLFDLQTLLFWPAGFALAVQLYTRPYAIRSG